MADKFDNRDLDLGSLDFNRGMLQFFHAAGLTILVRGLLTVAFGILILKEPAWLAFLLGAFLVVDGLSMFINGFRVREGRRETMLVLGLLMLLGGALIMVHPLTFTNAALILSGVWMLMSGIQSLFIGGSQSRTSSPSAVIMILVGLALVICPMLTLISLNIYAATVVIFIGISELALGVKLIVVRDK